MRTLTALTGFLFALILCTGVPFGSNPAEAGTTVRMDVPQMVERSDLILEGRVLSARALEAQGRVETEYLIAVERTFAGEDVAFRTVRFPGGVLEDGSGTILAGMPRIQTGEDVLLFLSQRAPRGIRMPVGLSQGKFRLQTLKDGTKRLIQRGEDMTLADPATGKLSHSPSLRVRDYAEVVAQIQTTLARIARERR